MKYGFTARRGAYIGLSAAILAVSAWLSVPAAVPFTMQTFAVCLVAALLGRRDGVLAVLVYLLLGAVGLPVFSGFKGGLGALLGVTGGYLVGFLVTALTVGLGAERFGRKLLQLLPFMLLGLALCYAFGTAWFVVVYTRTKGPMGVGAALGMCVLPYLPADAVKLTLAAALAERLYPLLRREGMA